MPIVCVFSSGEEEKKKKKPQGFKEEMAAKGGNYAMAN